MTTLTNRPAGDPAAARPTTDATGHAAVEDAVARARAAFPAWRRTSPSARGDLLRAAAAQVRDRREELARLHTQDTGRLYADALGAADVAASLLDEAAATAPLDAGRSLGGSSAVLDVTRREPRGLVAVITPWNDPLPAAAGLLAAALASGNVVVHKPSERSSRVGGAFGRLVAAALPDGVLEVVDGDGAVGEALVAHEGVDVVAHVGSTRAGRRIAEVAGRRGARLLLENGGNDVLLVDAGVDPGWAAEQAAIGAFTNAGQLCTAVERVVVHADVAQEFVAALVEQARAWRTGDPFDPATRLGPLVDARAAADVLAQLDDAVAGGAQVLSGGTVGGGVDGVGGGGDPRIVEATVLTGCTTSMRVWREETFGPVAPVIVVDSFEAGLALAADDVYGLAATVLTPSMEHALLAADTLDVGTVKVNAVFGGAPGGSADPRRASGTGRGYGPDLLGELTALKTVHLEPAPARQHRG